MKISKTALKKLEKQIKEDVKAAIADVMVHEVFETVRDIVLHHVQVDVYDKYEPNTDTNPRAYRRRYENQGLGDENNIVYEVEGNGTLVVWNIAKFNPRNRPNTFFSTEKRKHDILQKLIIDGWSTATSDSPTWMQPRPFIANANKSLNQGGSNFSDLDKAFETGLARFQIYKRGTKGVNVNG